MIAETSDAPRIKPRITEKRWDPKTEATLLKQWDSEGVYRFNIDSGKPVFSIDTPPPYASGKWHVGGATHYAQIDMVARYQRMKAQEVLFPFGIDRNGLPVEMEVEKKHGVSAHETAREEFIELCRAYLDDVEGEILKIGKRLGLSVNFEDVYRTDSPEYRATTQSTFIELWHRGLIYEDDRPSNWCSVCGTTIADAEIEYVNLPTRLCYVKFGVKDGGTITVATTRPELICSCAAVIYNPEDTRYTHLAGKHAVTPIYGVEVPIVPSAYAKPEFGTGVAMICSYGDYTDVRLFRELNLKPRVAVDHDGRMNDTAGKLRGYTVAEARDRMVEYLEQGGMLERVQNVEHNTPICWRSKNAIEFINMKEYHLKQVDFLSGLSTAVDDVKFHPPEAKQLLLNWINSVNVDWPISRRRFYGTEIPLWYCQRCGKPHLPPPGRYHQPWKENPPNGKCECGSTQFVGETRTFDTWMDSSISQLYVLGYKRDEESFKKLFPCSLRPQGTDIVRTWLYYSMLRTFQPLSAAAFRHVRISGMGLDERGEAMHKSKGNVVYPENILDTLGADAFRLWGASEARLGSNYRYSRERLDGSGKFVTKLWNIARFISSFPMVEASSKTMPLDDMVLSRLNTLIAECQRGYEDMDFFIPAQAVRDFMWNVLADHYLEAAKGRAYNIDRAFTNEEQQAAWFTLHTILRTCIKLLAPICPFVTDAIWRKVYGERSIHLEPFPTPVEAWRSEMQTALDAFMEFNSTVWRFKKSKMLPLNESLRVVYAPEVLRPLAADLKAMHRIENLHFQPPSEEGKASLEQTANIYVAVR
ncbi:MAG: valine--tRNA ligase [Candidatus Bathyarchaeia archaeon]